MLPSHIYKSLLLPNKSNQAAWILSYPCHTRKINNQLIRSTSSLIAAAMVSITTNIDACLQVLQLEENHLQLLLCQRLSATPYAAHKYASMQVVGWQLNCCGGSCGGCPRQCRSSPAAQTSAH